jgi:hypothetical protein
LHPPYDWNWIGVSRNPTLNWEIIQNNTELSWDFWGISDNKFDKSQ